MTQQIRTIPTPEEQPLMQAAEVGFWTGINKHSIYRMIKEGQFDVVRNGRHIYVTTASVRRLVGLD